MIWVFVTATLVSACSVPLILPLLRARAMDIPGNRSSHDLPTPRGGGLAAVVGIVSACGAGLLLEDAPGLGLVVAIVMMACLGLADDLWDLRASLRLLVTLLVAIVTAASIVAPDGPTSWLVVAVSATLIGGYTNTFNFMDGVNGISAINAVLAGGWLGFLIQREGGDAALVLALGLAGASLGFLPWNAPRARVFLGDSGSYGLGFTIAVLALMVWQTGVPLLLTVAPLWIYVVDTFSVFVRRIISGKSWSEAHRDHVYQRLVDGGLSHLGSAALVAVTSGLVCVLAWFTREVPALSVITALAMAAIYMALPLLLRGSTGTSRAREVSDV